MKRPAWNLLTGTLTRYILLFVNIAIGIFLMPFTMHHLGKAQYGLWMLAASMTAYLQLLDLGYGNGLVRQVTQADARGDEEEMNVILSTFLVVYSCDRSHGTGRDRRHRGIRAPAIPESLRRRRIHRADGRDRCSDSVPPLHFR